jgi:hypothetical protein
MRRYHLLARRAMFGKVFSSMYDGTLATRGPWQALVTFQQFIVLADRTGIVDMTAEAIARRTTIPLEIINIGITALEQPDSESRSPDLDGRRIARLSDTRAWGWQIVNYQKYSKIRSEDERREYMKNLMRERRAAQKATNPDCKQVLAKLAHVDVDVDVDVDVQKTTPRTRKPFVLPTDIDTELWREFLEMRTRIKKPATDRARWLIIGKLANLEKQGYPTRKVLQQSIRNAWQDVFPLREDKQ